MQNQNNNNHGLMLMAGVLLAVVVSAGLFFFSFNNLGKTNVLFGYSDSQPSTTDCVKLADMMKTGAASQTDQDYYQKYCVTQDPTTGGTTTTSTQYTCDGATKDINSGTYTTEEKAWYNDNCQSSTTTSTQYTCDGVTKNIDSGAYTVEEKTWYEQNCTKTSTGSTDSTSTTVVTLPKADPCGDLSDTMAKYANDPKSEEYLSAKWKYDAVCVQQAQPSTNICSDLKVKLEEHITNNDTNSDEYAKLKLSYLDLCTETTQVNNQCVDLKAKLELFIANGDSNSDAYASTKAEFLKTCQKPVEQGSFEDNVSGQIKSADNPFKDTDIAKLEGKAAFELFRRNVIQGFEDGTFRGKDLVNRAQAAKFLLLARFGLIGTTDSGLSFKDVVPGQWYEKFVLAAGKLGVINGYSDGTFRPANTVNTAEFLKMLTLTFDLPTGLPYSYTDVQASDWFSTYAGVAAKYNLFPDRTSGELQPASLLTRGEVAIAIYQYLSNRSI